MKRVKTAVFAGVTAAVLLSGCGYKEYETQHDSGTLEVDNFTKLLVEKRASPKQAAKLIPDFCIYGKERHYSDFHVNWNNYSFQGKMVFNEDDELTTYCLYLKDFKSDEVKDETVLGLWDNILSDLGSKGATTETSGELYQNLESKTIGYGVETSAKMKINLKNKEYNITILDDMYGNTKNSEIEHSVDIILVTEY